MVARVRAEFREMPGLRLTVPQAMRLWGLERAACQRVVDLLIDSSLLEWTADAALQIDDRTFQAKSGPLRQEAGRIAMAS